MLNCKCSGFGMGRKNMAKISLFKLWRNTTVLILTMALCHPVAFALDEKGAHSEKAEKREKEEKDLAELLRRLEKAEASVVAARDAAVSAKARAAKLEDQVEEVRTRLDEAKKKLENFSTSKAADTKPPAATVATDAQENNAQESNAQ